MCYCSNYNILKNNNNNSYNFYISELLYLKLSYHSTIFGNNLCKIFSGIFLHKIKICNFKYYFIN